MTKSVTSVPQVPILAMKALRKVSLSMPRFMTNRRLLESKELETPFREPPGPAA